MAHFLPTSSTTELAAEALEYMILHVLAESGPSSVVEQIRSRTVRMFHISFDEDEIAERLKALTQKKIISYGNKTGYYLEPRTELRLKDEARRSSELEQEVLGDWIADVRRRVISEPLTSEDEATLRQDLLKYISLVYHVHGADCATFITRDAEFAGRLLREGEGQTLSQLPARGERLDAIRSIALPLFFQNGDAKRRMYLSGLLNSSFVLMMMTGDKTMAAYWRENWRNATFYLDTNFLLRVLGLQGQSLQRSAVRVLELCRKTGIAVRVTNVTLRELDETLLYWRKELSSRQPPNPAFAQIALDARTFRIGFPFAYYEFIATGGNPSDFFARFTMVEEQLKVYQVLIDRKDYFHIVQGDPRVEQYMSELLAETEKTLPAAEHDAIHRLLIERERGGIIRDPLQAKVWFLTCDGGLAAFEHRRALRDNRAPTVISTATWLQLVRPIIGRNIEDYDSIFLSMVTSPHLRAFDRVTPEMALDVASRIQKYENIPPDIACALMQNSYVVQRLANATADEEEKIVQLEVAEALKAERHRAEESRKELESVKKGLQEMQAAMETAAAASTDLLAELTSKSALLEESRRRAAQAEAQLESQRQQAERIQRAARDVGSLLAALIVTMVNLSLPWDSVPHWGRILGLIALLGLYASIATLYLGIDTARKTLSRPPFRRAAIGTAIALTALISISYVLHWESYWNFVSTAVTLVPIMATVAASSAAPYSKD